jgi:hypothetical protein
MKMQKNQKKSEKFRKCSKIQSRKQLYFHSFAILPSKNSQKIQKSSEKCRKIPKNAEQLK